MGYLQRYFSQKHKSKSSKSRTQRRLDAKKRKLQEYQDRHELVKLKVEERIAKEQEQFRKKEEHKIKKEQRQAKFKALKSKAVNFANRDSKYLPKYKRTGNNEK